jgi:hypothetical protein
MIAQSTDLRNATYLVSVQHVGLEPKENLDGGNLAFGTG